MEDLVGRLFKRAGFEVTLNPLGARPRQTDLIASKAGATYVIETKWTRKSAGSREVDDLRARLHRFPQGAVGVLVSVGGFSGPAVVDAETHRHAVILLIDKDELEDLLGGGDLRMALKAKEDALRLDGRALVGTTSSVARVRRRPQGRPAGAAAGFVLTDGVPAAHIESVGGFGAFTFTREVTDIDWVAGGGAGVSIDLRLGRRSEDGIVAVLAELADIGWASGDAQWCVQQAATNWHGVGGDGLASALAGWRERYAKVRTLHHTEQVTYTDTCPGGFYTLNAQIDADDRAVYRADLSFQLSGVPLDGEPFERLTSALEVQHAPYFRPRNEPSVFTQTLWGEERVEVSPLAWLVEPSSLSGDDMAWAGGVVVANPYFRHGGSRSRRPPWLAPQLADVDILICELADWHPVSDPLGAYVLSRYEHAWTSDALVVRVTASWPDGLPPLS